MADGSDENTIKQPAQETPRTGSQPKKGKLQALGQRLSGAKSKVLDPAIDKFNEDLKKKSLQLGG